MAAQVSDLSLLAAQAGLEVPQFEALITASAGEGDRDPGQASPPGGRVGGDPGRADARTADTGAGDPALDKISTRGEEGQSGRPREVARFEELLTPEGGWPARGVGDDAEDAANLGVQLEEQGDLEGALAAYRRADERGDINGSFNLGCLLAELGDIAGAVGALGRADELGDAAGSSNLGVLLEQEGDLDGAIAAYRRADERGDENGAFNLGLLLAGRGDLTGAREAYQRAVERGDAEVGERARAALQELEERSTPAEPEAVSGEEPQAEEPSDLVTGHDGATPEQAPQAAVPEAPAEPHSTDTSPSAAAPDQTSRNRWIVALCLLGLIGLVVVLVRRRRR